MAEATMRVEAPQLKIHNTIKGPVSLNTLRTMDPQVLLAEKKISADGTETKGALFGKPRWSKENAGSNQAELQNAKAYATQQAEQGIAQLTKLNKPDGTPHTVESISKLTPDELKDLAEANKISVDTSDTEATKAKQEREEYITNAQGLAKEKQAQAEAGEVKKAAEAKAHEEEQAQSKATEELIAAGESVGMSHEVLLILGAKGELPAVAQARGVELIQEGIASENPPMVAFGLDMQIAGIQLEIQTLSGKQSDEVANHGSQKKFDALGLRKKTLENQLNGIGKKDGLIKQRSSGKVEITVTTDGKEEQVIKDVPRMPEGNELTAMASMFGAGEKVAEGNPLGAIKSVIDGAAEDATAREALFKTMNDNKFAPEDVSKVDELFKAMAKQKSAEALQQKGSTILTLILLLIAMGGYAAFQKNKAAHGGAMGG